VIADQRDRLAPNHRHSLDQLALERAGIGGQDDIADARRAKAVREPLDEQAVAREQRRGHRAAADFDDVEPAASGKDGEDGEEGPDQAPRAHRSRSRKVGR
jgi:hypothetical protein